MLFLLSFFRLDRTVLLACLIPAMAPTGIVSTLFAIRYKQDAALATRSVALSTLFSIVTMPLMIVFADWINRF
jgi:predicted permease